MPRDITTGDQELAMADLTKQISTLVAALSKLRQVGTASEHQGTDTTKLADLVLLSVKSFGWRAKVCWIVHVICLKVLQIFL
uniref:Uncharacterized protein n=1 Tax=Caenorhabditis japonica TaxID=281687 RepID=A0A8R1E9L0_CAEJA